MNMKSRLVYQGPVWHVQRAGLMQPLVLCLNGAKTFSHLLPTLRPNVWHSAVVIHMEAGGCRAASGREGVPVGGGSWILG